jgi:Ras-related protein Rab-6A
MKQSSSKQKELKTIMLGKTTVGKTYITTRIAGFDDNKQCATVGASFIMAKRGNIKYNIWDTGGQERFRCLMPMYIRDSKIVIFVFDVSDISTLDEIDRYVLELGVLKDYYIIIVGNKTDLLDDDQLKDIVDATSKKLENFALKEYVYAYAFVSAKTLENFDNFLLELRDCAKKLRENDNENTPNTKANKVENTINVIVDQNIKKDGEESQCSC